MDLWQGPILFVLHVLAFPCQETHEHLNIICFRNNFKLRFYQLARKARRSRLTLLNLHADAGTCDDKVIYDKAVLILHSRIA